MEDRLVGALIQVDRRQNWYSDVQGPPPHYPVYDYYFYCDACRTKYKTGTRYKIWPVFLSSMGKCRQPCAQCRKELNPDGERGLNISGTGEGDIVKGSLRIGVKSSQEILDPRFTL